MLFWEALQRQMEKGSRQTSGGVETARIVQRLPFDTRCAAKTKTGHRCRGRVRKGSDFCPFHDPAISAEQRRTNAAKAARSRKRLSRLPDGYLRKLNSAAAVAEAMDRLYREVRLGLITPEMGKVLLDILTRIAQSYIGDGNGTGKPSPSRKKIAHLRPKLADLLTRRERTAWREAVARAPRTCYEVQPPTAADGSPDDVRNRPDHHPRDGGNSAPLALMRIS